ncbi:MAG: hypothetical protein Q9170_004883 [Blastenia crenularia]
MADEKMAYASTPDMEKEAVAQERRRSVPTKVAKHANDADEAMKAFAGREGEVLELDEATKTTLSYASVMGIKKDIDLKGDDYQWLGSMFYFGQSSAESRSIENTDGHFAQGGTE